MSVPPASAHHLMRPVLWSFGEGPTFPGYTDDTRWNGFLNVSVGIDVWPYVLRELIAGADGDAERIAEYRGLPSDSSMVSLANRFTTEIVDRDWTWRFPDYPVATMMPIPQHWADMSWHGDTAPSFGPCIGPMGEAAQVWIDYADIAKREFPDLPRFSFCRRDAVGELTTIYAGDDYDAVLVHASLEALACAFAKLVALELSAEQWQMIRLVNRDTPAGTCASHDFVDANMLMLAAWEAERGNALVPDGERTRIEDDFERINAAWVIATRYYLTACDEGARFDAWRLTGRDVEALAAAGEELGRIDGSDSPGRIYATGHIERDSERWIVNAGNSSQDFEALFDAEAHLWSVHASSESVQVEKLARRPKPIRMTPRPHSVDLDADELTVTIDAIEHRLVVLTQRAATTAEFSSEGLFLAESRRRLTDARDKLRDASR